jgi:hypothetical protein
VGASNLPAAAGVFIAAFLLVGFGDDGRDSEVAPLLIYSDES